MRETREINDTRERLLDHAERLFAEVGYTATSMRRLTAEAATDLGAVRYHFGSKIGLYRAMLERRLEPLCEDRLHRLDALIARAAPAPPALEDIVRTFFAPVVQLMVDSPHGATWVRVIARSRSEPEECNQGFVGIYETLFGRYLEVLATVLPGLPAEELRYRLFFVFGAGVATFVDRQALSVMGGGSPDVYQDPPGVLERLVRFAAAGLAGKGADK